MNQWQLPTRDVVPDRSFLADRSCLLGVRPPDNTCDRLPRVTSTACLCHEQKCALARHVRIISPGISSPQLSSAIPSAARLPQILPSLAAMDFPIIMTTPTMEDIPPWPAPQASDLSIAACPPLTTNQPTLNAQPRSQQSDNIGIFEGMANSKDERYNPYMLPDEAVFQIHVVSEIMYDGRVQNMEEISLSRQATWKEAQPSLITAATSWQSEPWGCGSRDGKWLYQLTHNGLAEKQSRPLESVTNWKALKWFMLEGNAECERTGEAKAQVIVWHVRYLFPFSPACRGRLTSVYRKPSTQRCVVARSGRRLRTKKTWWISIMFVRWMSSCL